MFIDLDHLLAYSQYVSQAGWSNALNPDAAMASGVAWKSIIHDPVFSVIVGPLSIGFRYMLPLLVWGLHLTMDWVQIDYLGVASPIEMALALGLLVAIAAFGTFGVGVFTLSYGIHGLFALIAFVFVPLAAIASSTVVTKPTRCVFWVLAAWSLIGLVLHVFEINGPLGEGGMERFFVYPSMLFVLVFGGYLLAKGDVLAIART